MKMHLSPHMLLMKFPTFYGTRVIRGYQLSARTFYATTLKSTALNNPMEALASDLRHHSEVFALSYNDMPGNSPDVICHKLNISPVYKPMRQKRRSYDAE
ncbi:hypothetical protein L3X38_011878 [Prunus dulcis]|uniref:Uncharacterized protein n=1 Tax=Prunus dulcis TaxID=3755 RepID=A0AAD4ZFU5_PRUDU|nr:hypothetical protein L3X38_011878 [Prunus dulcis]